MWGSEHLGRQIDDAYFQLQQNQQVIIFRLGTAGHNELKYHLFNWLQIGDPDEHYWGTGKMTAKNTEFQTYAEQIK